MAVKEVMGVEEFAEYAPMHPETVRRKCRTGELPAFRAGKRWAVLAREYTDAQLAEREERRVHEAVVRR